MEYWLHAFAFPHRVAATAAWAEEQGFDGVLVADSQNLNADAWIELALAAEATERIGLGTGVTNPVTRHPAVTAAAAATLQEESGGRAVLGLGRGDSALAQIGRSPAHVSDLERALVQIQAFLAGETADLDEGPSRIGWIAASGQPKVPVAIAATGPHVIAVGARHAEQIDFTVGAEPERLRWAIAAAREAGAEGTSLGAFVNVGVHRDRAVARDLVRGSAAIFARFATEGAPPDGLSAATRRGIEEIAAEYDESRHGQAGAVHARRLGDDFIDRFAVVGGPEEVAERLREIASLGIERIVAVPGSLDADPEQLAESNDLLATAVLPALR
ncbi:MAG: LLM class flavin-dependent oxidoreductase [Thermoleophilia bacterium]|nr:LLM class flavin-dependent oxidoreductase [Thermoleophilia bacterium]